MKGRLVLTILLAGVLCAGLAPAIARRAEAAPPVQTVAQVLTLLRSHPATVVGRTLRVRGILEGPLVFCAETRPCPPPTLGLIDSEHQIIGPDRYLPLVAQSSTGLWTFLRGIRPLQALLPAPQHLQFGLSVTYRLQVRAAPILCSRNRDLACYEGAIEDAGWA